ncbi:hypothetical protein Hanom_Chr03g00187031 [Helianthus anomalus]
MKLMSWMKMTRFQNFWIQMRKNKPLDKSRKSSQTSGRKMAFYSIFNYIIMTFINNTNNNYYNNKYIFLQS